MNYSQRKEIIQEVIDRLLYCDKFEDELRVLISKYNPKKNIKYTTDITEFKFPLEKAI